MNYFIDTHAHYNSRRFQYDFDKVIEDLRNSVCFAITCGTNTKTIEDTIKLINKYSILYATIGYFPHDVLELYDKDIFENYKKLFNNEKVLGIGEIGLDYYHKTVDKKKQIEMFNKQIDLANELKLPVCIHSRDAEADTYDVLKNNKPKYGASIHCFAYGTDAAEKYLDMGFYFGVGGTCTYKNNEKTRKAIKEVIPLQNIILETDAPYLTPEPVKGTKNHSKNIKYVIKELSKMKKVDIDDIIDITNKNVFDLYLKLKSN